MSLTKGRGHEKLSARPRSVIPGRQRWDIGVVRGRPRLAAALETSLRAAPGVLAAHANPVTGRLLIHHDPCLTGEEAGRTVLKAVAGAVREITGSGQVTTAGQAKTDGGLALIAVGASATVVAVAVPASLVGLGAVLGTTAIIIRSAWRKSKRAASLEPSPPKWARQPPLLTIVGRHRKRFYLASALSVLGQLMDMLLVLVIGWIVLVLVRGESAALISVGLAGATTQIWVLAGAAALVCLGLAALSYTAGIQWRALAHDVRHEWRDRLYPHVQRLELRYLEDERTTRMARLLTDDINQLGTFLSSSAHEVLTLTTSFLVLVPVFLVFAPQIAWVAFLPVPIVTWLSFRHHDKVGPDYVDVAEKESALNSRLTDNLAATATVKSFSAENHEIQRVRALSERYRDSGKRLDRGAVSYTETVRVSATVSLAGILLLGGRAVLAETLRFEIFNPLVGLPQQVLWKLPNLGNVVDGYQQTAAALHRVRYLEDLPTESGTRGHRLDVAQVKGEMVLENVTFAYPGRAPVLRGLTMHIAPKKVTGIVGVTGSGKTTIAKLMMRFQRPESGRVLLDGQDVTGIRLRDLRRAIGFVAQDAFLFDGTIADNIRYGSFQASHRRVVDAARMAAVDEFVETLPSKYATKIGERGVSLSGGQKQRISLARAFVKDAPIVVLDEATSAVDNETESAIQHALRDFARDRTLVVIAHRLSTIRHADHIYVLGADGVPAEEGTHEELLRLGGVYASLWRLQVGEAG
ncbi:ABC transporter ATP-binding protein [Amycolatopsis alba DSM 44262]|uniref:ABC transporter ATP-binding protein n=1 Tax=Amycolatopsis alba DSM 44262 TaxID=1125972 RepID=A0A229RIV6_AMYAL|nr:ABC transporter ATP-binding protein/permease [Amycolatopsis alba]OXM46608.1 ABC transporter ATP-binding protein [Amycolatopsis alba DSM 44262]